MNTQIQLLDSHCHLDHLDLEPYGGSMEAMLEAARKAGVSRVLTIGIDVDSSRVQRQYSESLPGVYASVGVHPMHAGDAELPQVTDLLALADSPRVIAIGETGLDCHYNRDTFDVQKESFIRHAQAAKQLRKPLIVHTRDAQTETLEVIREHVDLESSGVLHCFTESWEMAREALDLNFYLSFSGIVTFKNAEALREVVRKAPLERILVETDAPWLAPVPYRGKKNEPRYVVEVARCVAELKGLSLPELASITTDNFERLFSL